MASNFDDQQPAGMIGRIKRILLEPKAEWPRIDTEQMTAKGVFMAWAVPLAAIGPVCGFIGRQLFGVNLIVVHYRPPLVSSLVSAVIGYIAALIGVWVLALIIDALAPTFNGVKNQNQAMKVAAFSYTAAWVAGVFQILPPLAIVGALLGLYSFYLLWLGLPVLMKSPPDKSTGYVVVTIIVSIVVYLVIGAIVGVATSSMLMPSTGFGSPATGSVTLGGVDLGKIDAATKQMAASSAAIAQGTSAAANGATVTAGTAKIVDPNLLQAMLPATIAGFTRTTVENSSGSAAGIGGSTAKATYTQGDQSFELSVSDAGALGAIASLGGALNLNTSKQTATGNEKTSTVDGQMVEEDWDNSNHSGKFSTMVANRFAVSADGSAPDIDTLKSAVGAVDLGKLADMAK